MIAIVDYGVGNVRAFANVYHRLAIECCLAKNIKDLRAATKIILPGVGAFDHAMTLLDKSGMREALDDLVLTQRVPVLGICVGMQLMAASSEEGKLEGLGWISGEVKKFNKLTGPDSKKLPLPHMGWNSLSVDTNSLLFEGLAAPRCYFLHSYYLDCDDQNEVISTTDYGQSFCVAVNKSNVYGIQCHPEKSHQDGVKILQNFALL
ncbi:imidazole glycerol phosphate synthase subunit HisH [Halodesulfovibrio aestuarii]|uniref:Imidazole glycerol phosphate synthase subunit HisH n=1 Tax=Halodesulfovibrio aestuarii TaxID=126333 RepID=A0ABV4JU12_9BACT